MTTHSLVMVHFLSDVVNLTFLPQYWSASYR